MKDIRIILASASPRRKELLSRLGWEFEVMPSDAAEAHIRGEAPSDMVMRLSRLKGRACALAFPDALVIASDTAVFCGGEILGKPADAEDAFSMLKTLRGRAHEVYSGLALFLRGECSCSYARTEVVFRALSDEDLRAYITTGECFGCAGAYAIQGKASLMVERISGDYSNVVGLPMPLLAEMLKGFSFSVSDILH